MGGPENGNFPSLYAVKMSLPRWSKKALKTPLCNIKWPLSFFYVVVHWFYPGWSVAEIKCTVASRYYALDCVAHYQARTLHSTRYVMIIS